MADPVEFEGQRPDDLEEEPLSIEEVKARSRELLRAVQKGEKSLEEAAKESDNLVNQAAGFDPLIETVHNKRWFNQKLEEEVALAKRSGGIFTVILADLDFFDEVNTALGHPGGDVVLQKVGAQLKKNTRKIDTVARFGGDEFALILRNTDGLHGLIVAERILMAVPQLTQTSPQSSNRVDLSISIGVAQFNPSDENESAKTLLERADKALYAVKDGGRNGIGFAIKGTSEFSHSQIEQQLWNDPALSMETKNNAIGNIINNTILVRI